MNVFEDANNPIVAIAMITGRNKREIVIRICFLERVFPGSIRGVH